MIISDCQIYYYNDSVHKNMVSWGIRSSNERQELFPKLADFYKHLGVDAYRIYDTELIEWRLGDCWYTTSQIERIKRLPAFL